jgi:imidazoleglycerol-phosphate dehydratase / histidinol-phosphatase
MPTKVLFIDRDGTLIEEPSDYQVDSTDKVRLIPGVIPALLALQAGGYELVIVSNQDGLGTSSFPRGDFEIAHEHMLALFHSQGVQFSAEFFCPHMADEGCLCRKPAAGLLQDYLATSNLDHASSAVVGDRDTDLQLAANLGLRGFQIGANGATDITWSEIARVLLDQPRRGTVSRRTNETNIEVSVDLDKITDPDIDTGIGFFDHMLEQLGKHGAFALVIRCQGDLQVDEHHTVEDVALCLGEALRSALADKRGIQRYGFTLPMDEAEARVSIDLGGRPYLVFEGEFPRDRVGELPTELVPHFFRSLSDTLGAAIHVHVEGENAHHMVEACFKGVARALRQAFVRDGTDLPSTKGVL